MSFFWSTPPQQIRDHFKRHFCAVGTAEAAPHEQIRIPPNQTSPWANIPSDILCYICDQAFSETSAHYGVEMLALVCKLWYKIVTAYGRPWSIIRIEPNLHKSTVYPTIKSYVNTRLKHSHPYPLNVAIHPLSPEWSGSPNFLQKDIRNAIDAVVGEGLHARRWGTLDVTVHPFVRARLKHPTPVLRRVTLVGVMPYGWDFDGLFPMAPNLRDLSLTGMDSAYYLQIPASTLVTTENLRLQGFSAFTCISLLEKFVKTRRLTTLELTGTRSSASQRASVTLPTVHTLILNVRGPISVMFSALILPGMVELVVIGGDKDHRSQNVLDDHGAFQSFTSKLETLRLEFLRFDNKDHLKNTLVAVPKVNRLVMRGITCDGAPVDPIGQGPTLKGVGGWISGRWALGRSREPDYVTLLKDPLIFPVLSHCTVGDIDRKDLVVLRRPREVE